MGIGNFGVEDIM